MTRATREVRSWKDLLDRCLGDAQRFRRMIVLIVVVAAVILVFAYAAGWPTTSACTLAIFLARRHALK